MTTVNNIAHTAKTLKTLKVLMWVTSVTTVIVAGAVFTAFHLGQGLISDETLIAVGGVSLGGMLVGLMFIIMMYHDKQRTFKEQCRKLTK